MDTYYITGASRGLGRAMAAELLKDQANRVYGIGRTCTLTHARHRHLHLDLTAVKAVREFHFRLPGGTRRAVLINNAGVIAPVAPVGKIKNQTLTAGFAVNLISPAILMNNFIRDTQRSRAELLIVNISSGAGRHAVDSWSMYCAAKAGLDMFSEVLHSEQPIYHPKRPVRIFSIAPGVVDTGMQEQIRAVPRKDFAGKQHFIQMKADGMLAPADKTAKAILRIIRQPENYSQTCLDVREIR